MGVPPRTTRRRKKDNKTGWNFHSKTATDVGTITTQKVNKAVGLAGTNAQVCWAGIMANSKSRFL